MPWGIGDVDRFKKGLSDEQKRRWLAIANGILASCMSKEGAKAEECERIAIATASKRVDAPALKGSLEEIKVSLEALRTKVEQAVFQRYRDEDDQPLYRVSAVFPGKVILEGVYGSEQTGECYELAWEMTESGEIELGTELKPGHYEFITDASFTDRPWDGDKARYSLEQLLKAVPRAIAAWARKQAEHNPSGEILKGHLKFPYKEPDGTINIHGVRNALARLSQGEGLPNEVKAAARTELERVLEEYHKLKGDSFVSRVDAAGFTWKEENGLLIGEIAFAKPGVYPYFDPQDGKTHYEFKPPEEILSDGFLQQTCLLPITDEHPSEGEVNEANIARLIKGMSGTSPRRQGDLVLNVGAIHDPALKEQIKRGDKRQVSIGFRTVVVDRAGEYQGQPYDRVQTNIRLNHLAFTKAGRCGDQCSIVMDSHGRPTNERANGEQARGDIVGGRMEFTLTVGRQAFKFDCPVQDEKVTGEFQKLFEAAQAQINAIEQSALDVVKSAEKVEKDSAELKRKYDALVKEYDAVRGAAQANADVRQALEKKIAEVEQKVGDTKSLDLRLALIDRAKALLGDGYVHAGKSNFEIKVDLARHYNPEFKAEGVSEQYLDAYLAARAEADSEKAKLIQKVAQDTLRGLGQVAPPLHQTDAVTKQRELLRNLYGKQL